MIRNGLPSAGPMTDQNRCEALFVSPLQGSESVSATTAEQAIDDAIAALGSDGCASQMAQEFGDHPQESCDRMRWVHRLLGQIWSDAPARAA